MPLQEAETGAVWWLHWGGVVHTVPVLCVWGMCFFLEFFFGIKKKGKRHEH